MLQMRSQKFVLFYNNVTKYIYYTVLYVLKSECHCFEFKLVYFKLVFKLPDLLVRQIRHISAKYKGGFASISDF